jgi:hypothetical protein
MSRVKKRNRVGEVKKNLLILAVTLIICAVVVEQFSKAIYLKRILKAYSDADAQELLVLGDSNALLFPSMLQEKLGAQYRVLNDSESGAGPDLYLAKMDLLSDSVGPDAVIVPLCVSNDIINLKDLSSGSAFEKIKLFLSRRFYSYHLLKKIYLRLKYKKFDKGVNPVVNNSVTYVNPHLEISARENPRLIVDNLMLREKSTNKAWNTLDYILSEMSSIAKKKGFSLTVIPIPECVQVDIKHRTIYTERGFNVPEDFDDDGLFQERLAQMCEAHGIAFFDPLARLKKANGPLYFTNDPHLNIYGNKVISEIIFDYLTRVEHKTARAKKD